MPICPELSHVLASIVTRVKGNFDHVPPIERYDPHERVLSAALPYLFQRRRASGRVMHSRGSVGYLLKRAVSAAHLCHVDGQPLQFTPHDFRRLFPTETVNRGLPIHIAAKLLGHLDLNTPPAAMSRSTPKRLSVTSRRTSRDVEPSGQVRNTGNPPKLSGTSSRSISVTARWRSGTATGPTGPTHEHACVRCPLLRMDPEQLPRLLQIEKNTHDLLSEARENGWEGEVQGLDETFLHITEKKAQVERIRRLPLNVARS
jgi:Phage integrase family